MRDNKTPWERFGAVAALLVGLVALAVSGLALSEAGADVQVMGTTNLDSLELSENLTVGGDASVGDDLTVTGDTGVGSLTVSGAITAAGLQSTGNMTMTDLTVSGSAVVSGTFTNYGTTYPEYGIVATSGDVSVNDNLDITGTLDTAGAVLFRSTANISGNTRITGTLTLNGGDFAGPVQYGGTASVISGTLIAHGFGTTPTSIILTPVSVGGLTQTVYVMAANNTSFTVGLEPGDVTTIDRVYWMAGK